MMEKPEGVRPLSGERGLTPLEVRPDQILDCYGLVCPMPVRKTAQALEELTPGQVLQVIATEEWFGPDLEAWLRHHPHQLLALQEGSQEIHDYLRKAVLE